MSIRSSFSFKCGQQEMQITLSFSGLRKEYQAWPDEKAYI